MSIGFALTLLLLGGILPAVEGLFSSAFAVSAANQLDRNNNGIEDVLDAWLTGAKSWSDLQRASAPAVVPTEEWQKSHSSGFPSGIAPASGPVQAGQIRLLCLGADTNEVQVAQTMAAKNGVCRVIHNLNAFGGVAVLALDAAGLAAFLAEPHSGFTMLDRDGVPALVGSLGGSFTSSFIGNREMVGIGRVSSGDLSLGDDWSATIAILDSGADSAHGDLGDAADDDIDGPAPAVGDASDWFAADSGWPLFSGYRIVGWQDVTDDFPDNQGPWDYHHHGTALASVVAGSGAVESDYRGLAPNARLTIVKFYDFDEVWHAWAGDFLAACAWTLEHHEIYRIRTVLTAVNWPVDAGISAAMNAFVEAGITPVVAMGNDGFATGGPGYPASLSDVLTVGALNGFGAVSAFSGRGLPARKKPDLVAPGGGYLASGGRIMVADNEPNDTYSGRFGTSLAAAHAAAAVYMLDEALLENGIKLPANRQSVRARLSVLRLTSAFVGTAETPDGLSTQPLPRYDGHDFVRGYGGLRIDAAVRAMTDPLISGVDQVDTLSLDWQKPVVARRLNTAPGVRYLVEAIPTGNLDVCLEVVEAGLAHSNSGDAVLRISANGPGVSEFTYFRPTSDRWSFVVVKRLSGEGEVTLRLIEAEEFTEQGAQITLPGVATGAPNIGYLQSFSGPSIVVPSRVLVDPVARSLNVMDLAGVFRPSWPVFVFPPVSSRGGFTQPMVANLDGVVGDEIVVSTEYGIVYFFNSDGTYKSVTLAFNRKLTSVVGFRNAAGGWRVLVVDDLGVARTWSWNAAVNAEPELEAEVSLGHLAPLSPAVGQLTSSGGESLVIAFADGWLGVFDENLNLRPGWPQQLGSSLEVAPVLCDFDGDGLHEIIVPVLDDQNGLLVMRVFDGAGNATSSDGAVVPAPRGGSWLHISEATVAGRYGDGQLYVAVVGLADNGLSGDAAVWSMGAGRLYASGQVEVVDWQGVHIAATTNQGELNLKELLLPTPLAWDQFGDGATELGTMFHLSWFELLYGFTSIPGATTGWLVGDESNNVLLQKQPRQLGGSQQAEVSYLGSMLVPVTNGLQLRVELIDRQMTIMPMVTGLGPAQTWRAQRGDARNSGAYRLLQSPTPVVLPALSWTGLSVYPNPSGGRFQFKARSGGIGRDSQLEIFDLRGRRLRVVKGADSEGIVIWDGAGADGRRLAAGAYLALVRSGGRQYTTRVVLTR